MADPSQPPPHRYITTESIRAGDVILEEEAWIWSFLNLGSAKSACNYCFKPSKDLQACSACKLAFYCDATCQRSDWRLRHKHEECQNLKIIRQMAQKTHGAIMQNFEEIHFNILVPRLLLSAAGARLFHAKERDENGDPKTLLWETFMQSPYKADLLDLNRQPHSLVSAVCRSVKHKDTIKWIIKNRVLPSLVVLSDYGPWKKAMKDQPYVKDIMPMPQQLALGACLEMSNYPHCCDRPNAITINNGRTVRMIAMENIVNLADIRLTRMPAWLYEHRYTRRTAQLYKVFGYGCFCTRCSVGDMAAETTLFALRCPQWAKHYQTDKKLACNGVVKGLRRTDISTFGINTLTGQMDPDVDEPRPLSYRAAHTPLHERAICMRCSAKYDAETMKTKILPLLHFMEMMRSNSHDCAFISADRHGRDEWADKVMEAEKHVYPTNYIFLAAKRMLLRRVMHGVEMKLPGVHAGGVAGWLKNYLREVLARVEAVGCQQIDMFGLQEIVGIYGHYVEVARKSGGSRRGGGRRGLTIDAETVELFVTTAKRATEKLKVLFHEVREE